MTRWDELDRYVIITSDAHGGAAMADYKPYLEPRWHDVEEHDQQQRHLSHMAIFIRGRHARRGYPAPATQMH